MIYGIVTVRGYVTVDSEKQEGSHWDNTEGLRDHLHAGLPVFGEFGLPGVPAHRHGEVLIAPEHVVAIVEKGC